MSEYIAIQVGATVLPIKRWLDGERTVATPTVSPDGGDHETSVEVTLACATAGASIYYTTDGTTPTSGSTLYTGPFTLTESKYVRAIAVRAHYADSEIKQSVFTVDSGVIGPVPIAGWNVVPYQRINAGESIKVGVVAFAADGIEKVSFSVDGGAAVNVTSVTYNDQSDTWEYWTTVAATSFGTDESITVDATVYGNDGGIRELDQITFRVNPNSTLAQPVAYVATDGNDSTGAVNNSEAPYLTVMKAISALTAWNNANGFGATPQGGIVKMAAGTYSASQQGGIWDEFFCADEWVVVTRADGTSVGDVVLSGAFNAKVTKLCVRGITINGINRVSTTSTFASTYSPLLWMDNVKGNAAAQWTYGSCIAHSNWRNSYWTDDAISNSCWPTTHAALTRGVDVTDNGDDCFNIGVVVNCTANRVDPGVTGWHSDLFGHAARDPKPYILYNVIGTNLHYQGMWINILGEVPDYSLEGVAFVNVDMQLVDTVPSGGGSSGYYRAVDHLVMWHCTIRSNRATPYNHNMLFHADGTPEAETLMQHMSIKGNCFDKFTRHPSENLVWSDYDVDENHMCNSDGYGTNYTQGDPEVDSNYVPVSDSVLRSRISPLLVPCDALGNERVTAGDAGAYQYVAP